MHPSVAFSQFKRVRTKNLTSQRDQYSNKFLKTSAYNMVTIISVLIRRDVVVCDL